MFFSLSKFFLYIIPLNIVILSASTLFPYIVGKYVWFRTSVDLALIFFLLGLLFGQDSQFYKNRLFRIIKKPLVIAVLSFVLIFNIAGFFGFDPATSFWSNFERGEGGFQMLHLGIFFILLVTLFKNESDWRKMFYFSIVGAALMILYGVLALEGVSGFVGGSPTSKSFWDITVKNGERFVGSIGNPAYVAAYLIYIMFYTANVFIGGLNKKIISARNIALVVLFLVFLFFFFFSGTRGAFLGLVAAIISFLFYLAFSNQKWRKYVLISILGLLIVVVVLVVFKDSSFVKRVPGSRVFDISVSATTFKHRLIMWNIAIEGWKDRPIFGWGPENYYQVFDRRFDINYFKPQDGFGAWFDRAHNVFFDYLVETGVIGLLGYIAIFVVFYWQLFRFNKQPTTNNQRPSLVISHKSLVGNALLFAMPVAHLVQGMMLFEVLSIYLNLFLFFAFAAYYLYFREN